MDNQVLIVDDEARFAASLKHLFKRKGVEARVSLTGKDAICKFRETPVKVVISDIHMPHKNGFDLMTDLIRYDDMAQVIFLTGYASVDYIKRAFRQNAFEFFKKPIENIDLLVDAVAAAQMKYDRLNDRTRARRRTEYQAAAFGQVLNGIDAAIVVLDMTGCDVIFANRRFNLELGYRENHDLRGRKCLEVVHGNNTVPCQVCTNSRIVDHNGRPTGSFEWETDNARTGKRYSIVDKAIQWIDGRIVRLCTFFDITERRKHDILFREYEKKVHRLAELENIETLAGGIAHQFNNALSVISGNLELMEMESDREEKVIPYARAMKASAGKMVDLTSSLLAYARGGKYRIQQLLFHEVINGALESAVKDMPDHISIINQVPVNDLEVNVDQAQIRMLMSNILENAREAGADTIEIRGGGKLHASPRVNNTGLPRDRYLSLKIRDNGQGMDRETLDRVFQPFFTTRFQGRGLGLASSMGIVKGHNGFLFLESEAGSGTLVKVYLPAGQASL